MGAFEEISSSITITWRKDWIIRAFEHSTWPCYWCIEHLSIWTFQHLNILLGLVVNAFEHLSIWTFQHLNFWPGLVVVAFERPIRSCQQGLYGSRATSPTPLDFPTKMVFAWLSSIMVCFLIMIFSSQIWAYSWSNSTQAESDVSRWSKNWKYD